MKNLFNTTAAQLSENISIISTGQVDNAKVGDVDGDGYITALDSQLVALYVSQNIQQGTEVQIGSKKITIEQENIDRMDVNSDEQVNTNDITDILAIYNNSNQAQELVNSTETFELVRLEYNSGFSKIENGEITWEITNEEGTESDIATIDGQGNFKKVKEGTGYIKATHNGENTQLLIGIKDIKYSIKYDANQGIFSDDTSDKIYEINSENGYITLPEDVPTRKGYIFKGYSKNKSYNTEDELFQPGNSYQGEDFNISETTTLYACWTEEVYTITYNLDGGTVIENPNNYTIESETITLNNPTKEGYIFIGWTGSNGAVPEKTVTIPKGTTGNKQYTANWNKEVEEELISSDKYEIDQENKTIKIPSETSVDEFLSNVTIKGTKTVIIKNEKEIIGNEYIGTESTITIYEDEKDTKGTTYTFEVIGDVTGDGRMNITDVLKLRAHIVKTIELKGYYKIMADVNEDNDINSTDVMLLRKLITERQ